jgi:Zn-dependent peptidase ImmA (M78 family)
MIIRKQKTDIVDGSERLFKAYVVQLVLNGKTEESLKMLASHYKVRVPRLKVGLPSRHRTRAVGCYVGNDETIYLQNADAVMNPFIILHEFYHHLRTSIDKQHKGTEKYADVFAREFLEAYRSFGSKS